MAKKLKVVLELDAAVDLDELKEFLIDEVGTSIGLANRHISSILEFIDSFALTNIEHRPSRYVEYSWCSSRSYNKTWVIFFQILDDELIVIRIIHGKLLTEVTD